jgi:hypothetical protein
MSKTVCRNCNALLTSFSHLPLKMCNWIKMRFLNMRHCSLLFTFSRIPNSNYTICASTSYNICKFMVIAKICNRRWCVKSNLWFIWICKIPYIWTSFHLCGSLLESINSIWCCNFRRILSMPRYLANTSFANSWWIPKFFKQIYLKSICVFKDIF